jgi:hypothetical protein
MLLVKPINKGGFGLIHWKLHAREPKFHCQAASMAEITSIGSYIPCFGRLVSQFKSMALFCLPRG